MDTRKSSFRLLLALTSAVFVLLVAAACSSARSEPDPHLITPETFLCGGASTDMHIWRIRAKYDTLFQRQPLLRNITVGYMRNDDEKFTTQRGIIIRYANRPGRDQSALMPPEARIPDCIEGIPVQVIGLSQAVYPPWEKERLKSKGWPNTDPLWECTYDNTAERRKEILDKYEFLLRRYPNAWHTKASTPIVDEDGIPVRLDEKDLVVMGAKGQYGTIGLMITHWVDPDTVPPELQVPDCLEGIPMRIIVNQYAYHEY